MKNIFFLKSINLGTIKHPSMKKTLTIWYLLISGFLCAQNYTIYVSDAGNFNNPPWQILTFDGNGQNPEVFIDHHLNWPQDILFMEDSNVVLISNLGSGEINRHHATTGAFLSTFASSIGGPTRMKIGPDGLLYVLQWAGNGKVKRYQLDGSFVDDFTAVGVPQSIGLDWDDDENLYVSSYSGDLVRKFDSAGADMGIFINTNLLGPTNIWFDANGDLLVSDYNGTAIKRFNSSGNFVSNFMTGTSKSEGVAYLPNGNILIGNGATSSVKEFNANGTYLQDIIPSGSANLLNPNAVVIRETTGTSAPEIRGAIAPVIYPTIGNQFHVDQQYTNDIKLIRVFNSAGNLVGSFNNDLWTAHNQSNGTYFLSVQFNDGSMAQQKVVVQQ